MLTHEANRSEQHERNSPLKARRFIVIEIVIKKKKRRSKQAVDTRRRGSQKTKTSTLGELQSHNKQCYQRFYTSTARKLQTTRVAQAGVDHAIRRL